VSQETQQRILAVALRHLNRRERTVAEVRSRLGDEGAPAEVVDTVLGELSGMGLLDDARYARMFTEDKRELQGWGAERIRRTLAARGVDRALIDQALGSSGAPGDDDEAELRRAVGLLDRRFPNPPHGRRERERALGFLLRKGYAPELALRALVQFAPDGSRYYDAA
jgi:regulatory protein